QRLGSLRSQERAMAEAAARDVKVVIRPARADEGARLKEIAIAAKRFWGYELDRVREWADQGDFTPERLGETIVFVADSGGRAIVPHLRERPFTMKRYPHGIYGEVFFQKQAPKHIPSWIPTRQFRTWPREGGSRLVDFALVNSSEAVLFMVQNNCIDMNAW